MVGPYTFFSIANRGGRWHCVLTIAPETGTVIELDTVGRRCSNPR